MTSAAKRRVVTGIVLACLVSSCATFRREVHLSQAQLQEKVEKAFPIERRLAFVEMTFRHPQILLAAGGDRIGLALDVQVDVPGVGVLHGRMGADGGLAYRADRGEIIIVDARVNELDVTGLPKRYSKALREVAARVAQKYFAEVPVYRLDQSDFKQSLARLVLTSVVVRDGEVVATVGL